jgi:uncharacterized RDD family membrane protein YckC
MHLQKAGFGSRLVALFIDSFVTGAFFIPAYLALITGPKETYQCSSDLEETSTGLLICERPTGGAIALALVLGAAALVGVIFYWGTMEGKGQTLGKKAMSISTIDIDTGAPIGTGRAIGRYFARIISAFVCYLGYLWMLWDNDKQTWHDKMVRSIVVKS